MRRRVALGLVSLAVATLSALVPVDVQARTAAVATATPGRYSAWAKSGSAPVHPGVQIISKAGQCTANFVFTDKTAARNVYLGLAAHCFLIGDTLSTINTDGCNAKSLPVGSPAQVQGGGAASLVYSSWLTMQGAKERNANACQYNDFALVKLASGDRARTNPTLPFWGGPTTSTAPRADLGAEVRSFGNSDLRLGIAALGPKEGVLLDAYANGWAYDVFTATPGIPGDSGSAFITSGGAALGVLSTMALTPVPGVNTVISVQQALAYMKAHHTGTLDTIALTLGSAGSIQPLL